MNPNADPSFADFRVLLVEDDPVMRSYTAGTLKKLGIAHVLECADGSEALTAVGRFRPNLVLTDVHMRPMNGLEFVQAMRRLPSAEAAKAPVIFMSADASSETVSSAVPLGIKGYIVKPPRLADLKAKIEAALR